LVKFSSHNIRHEKAVTISNVSTQERKLGMSSSFMGSLTAVFFCFWYVWTASRASHRCCRPLISAHCKIQTNKNSRKLFSFFLF